MDKRICERRGLIVMAIAAAVAASSMLWADDLSSPGLYRGTGIQRVTALENVTPWVVQCYAAAPDGAALGDVYAWSGWTAAAKEATANAAAAPLAGNTYTGGRLLLCRESQKRYEVQILVDAVAGTVTLQPFAFPWLDVTKVPTANRGSLVKPFNANVALGIPFNRAWDGGANTITVTATPVIAKAGYTTVTDSAASTTIGVLYPDQAAGTTWYECTPLHFDSVANYAELPYVVGLAGGATKCIVLGKAN
jgi:hypothetical protein